MNAFVEVVSRKGANNGYASLDANGRVPSSQLPSSAFEYKGNWNANTNTPDIYPSYTGNSGDQYRVATGGTQNLGEGSTVFEELVILFSITVQLGIRLTTLNQLLQ